MVRQAWQVSVSSGVFRSVRVRRCRVGHGLAGLVWFGRFWYVWARSVAVWSGPAWQGRQGTVGYGRFRLVLVWQARFVLVRSGRLAKVRFGRLGQASFGRFRYGLLRHGQGMAGWVRFVPVGNGKSGNVEVRQARCVFARCVAARFGFVRYGRHGGVRCCVARSVKVR